jgi:hypothetical protein
MSCSHLLPAKEIQAYYSKSQRTLTLFAEVTVGPGDYGAQICRSLIDVPESPTPSFVVSAPAPSGIQPQYMRAITISESFAFEKPPASVFVYSAGIDAPEKTEVKVGDVPPPAPHVAAPARAPASAPTMKSVTGWSRSYHYHEALADAVRQLTAGVPMPNPDVGLNAKVVETGVAVGGFRANTGLYITLQTS